MHMGLGKESPRVVILEGWKSKSSRGCPELCPVLRRGPSIKGAELTKHRH